MAITYFLPRVDLKNAKAIVDWIAWAEPQYDFNPMIDEWCKEAPRELDFNIEAGMIHFHPMRKQYFAYLKLVIAFLNM